MQNLKILNSKEKRNILDNLKEQFQYNLDMPYTFLMNSEEKIFLVTQDLAKIDLEQLRVNNIGLYFGKKEKDGIRLSIEGSQIVGKNAQKNVLELTEEETMRWFRGLEISVEKDIPGYLLLKNKNDFIGCGKCKNGKIINYVEKGRRILPKSEHHLIKE